MLELNLQLKWDYNGQRGKETLFHSAIGNFQTSLRDWEPGLRKIADDILEPAVMNQFATQGQGRWQADAPSTIAAKGHDRILFDSGALFASFQKGGADHVQNITRSSLQWGSKVPYALFHQTGTGKGFQQEHVQTGEGTGRGMPMRKILAFTPIMKREMRSKLVQHLATIARREGFAVAGSGLDPLTARTIGSSTLGL